MPDLMRRNATVLIAVLLLVTACSPGSALRVGEPLELASFTENSVTVSVSMELDASGQTWLAATFTPLGEDTHMYSKDLPRDGVDGLGRPTLLELVPGSTLQAAGVLTESVAAGETDLGGLMVYPAGPVTLRLPVTLPQGDDPVDEQVSVTYMACGNGSCYPPVIGKIIDIRVPGVDAIRQP